jgi:hypothetical protein
MDLNPHPAEGAFGFSSLRADQFGRPKGAKSGQMRQIE